METIKTIFAKAPMAICIAALVLPACIHVDPVTVDVNVHYVDEKLDNAFAFQQKYEQAPASRASTRPATNPSSVNAEKLP